MVCGFRGLRVSRFWAGVQFYGALRITLDSERGNFKLLCLIY